VYFKEASPKLFVLTASEDAEPSYLLKIQTKEVPKVSKATAPHNYPKQVKRILLEELVFL
jgi:hypothetical protein